MARDRLAGLRGQQQGASYSTNGPYQQEYPTRQTAATPQQATSQSAAPYASQGYAQPYSSQAPAQSAAQPTYHSYEQSQPPQQYSQQQPVDTRIAIPENGSAQPVDEDTKFFNDISDIQSATRELGDNVNKIRDFHQRQLDTVANDEQHERVNAQLNELTAETRQLSNSLKSAIKRLEAQTAKRDPRDPNTNVRRTQVNAVKSRFMEAIQRYQQVEQESRKKHRQKMERQFKIVKPDASQQEVNEALDNAGSGNRIFEQALLNSNRYGDARAAYKEVQDRHVEIVKIEQTMTELAQMFSDMAVMVEEQEPTLVAIEAKAQGAETNMQAAEGQMQKAVKSARAARRKRWICFVIIIIILAIVGIVLGVHFGNN